LKSYFVPLEIQNLNLEVSGNSCLVVVIKTVAYEAIYDRGFSNSGIANYDDLKHKIIIIME